MHGVCADPRCTIHGARKGGGVWPLRCDGGGSHRSASRVRVSWLARRGELDDRDGSIRVGRISSITREGWEDTVREHPQPLTLSVVVHHRRVHRDPTERDVGMRSKVVVPGRVTGSAGIRCGDRDPVPVVEVDDRVASSRAALGAVGLDHGGREHECRGKAAATGSQQERVDLPADVAGDEPGEAARGERCIGAGDHARRAGRINVSELGSHRGGPSFGCGRCG